MTVPSQIEQWLRTMKQIAEMIAQLDLEEEEQQTLLLSLQHRQEELRKAIEQFVWDNQHSYSDAERQLLGECMVLERENVQKFKALQCRASEQLRQIATGKRSRDMYQQDDFQHTGFFIDNHR